MDRPSVEQSPFVLTRPGSLSAASLRPLKLGLLLLFVLVAARLAWVSDDAFISFRTVWNFVHGYGLRWNVDERVQAYTNPLWVFLIAAVYAVTRQIFVSAVVSSLVAAGLAVAVVLFGIAVTLPQALAFVSLLLLSQALLDYSTSGLENPLSYLLVALFCWAWLRASAGRRPLLRLFFIGALLVLNRQDLVLLVFPALALALWQQRSWRAVGTATLALTPILLWELFSVVYYGFPFPNTYYAKLNTGIPEFEYLQQGWTYLIDLLMHDPATLMTVLLGIVYGVAGGSRRQVWPLALGLVLYLIYTVKVGGDFMQGRFLTVPAFIAAIILVQRQPTEDWWQPLAPALLIAAIAATQPFFPIGKDPLIRQDGIADERQFYVAHNALVDWHRGLRVPWDHPWARTGEQMRDDPREHVFAHGTVGMVGYVAGPKVHIVDFYALADPLLARLPAIAPWRIGHFQRVVPPDYMDSLRSGDNRFQNPGLASLYDQLCLITRGPLFSAARWRAIWAMNTHGDTAQLGRGGQRQSVPLSRLSIFRGEGYSYYAAGTLQMYAAGIDVQLGDLRHAAKLTTSLDNNDSYLLRFMHGDTETGRLLVPPSPIHPDLVVHNLEVPQSASIAGYDHIEITPQGGDGLYGIGHLILLGR